MRAFPQNTRQLNIFYMEVRNEIRNWKKAFRKFSKIRRRRFQIFEYSIFGRNQMNEPSVIPLKRLNAGFSFHFFDLTEKRPNCGF